MTTIEQFVSRLVKSTASAVDQAQENLLSSLSLELVQTLKRVSELKNLIYRDRPAALREIFVAPELRHDNELLTDDTVFDRFISGEPMVIKGSAGLGKSVLLKHFCLLHVERSLNIIPLFIELRKLDNDSASDIIEAIRQSYAPTLGQDSVQQLKNGLKGRFFSLLLDGFDEVTEARKRILENAIVQFIESYPNCPIMVSGRNDRVFHAWDRFSVYEIAPMTKQRTINLIERLKYSEDLKQKFITDAVPALFSNKDKSFVQTPLLAILMLLTYELYAEVPSQMYLFYARAFETLLIGHDVTKSQFRRELVSGLSEEDFKKVFASFCAVTYSDKSFEFSRDVVISYLLESLDSTSVVGDPSKVLDDLVLSVCVMQYEGLEYSFVHRSFQEYFTAVYLKHSPIDAVKLFLESGFHPARENVIPMLFAMDTNRIETEWTYPALQELQKITHGSTTAERILGLLSGFIEQFRFSRRKKSLSTLHQPGKLAYKRLTALEIIYPMSDRGMWWFDGWESMSQRSGKLVASVLRGEIPSDSVVTKNSEVDVAIDRGQGIPKEYTFDLKFIPTRLYKKLGLWTYSILILNHIDHIKLQVEGRVCRSDRFSKRMFNANSLDM